MKCCCFLSCSCCTIGTLRDGAMGEGADYTPLDFLCLMYKNTCALWSLSKLRAQGGGISHYSRGGGGGGGGGGALFTIRLSARNKQTTVSVFSDHMT